MSSQEKKLQNKEILLKESSSLSSETGSWEPVFPFKNIKSITSDISNINNVQRSNESRDITSTSSSINAHCFIDASTLTDDEVPISYITGFKQKQIDIPMENPLLKYSELCAGQHLHNYQNDSPDDIHTDTLSHDNDDSLELNNAKESDSLQKDQSPTIFDMTPITEDSLSTNPIEKIFTNINEVNDKMPTISSSNNHKCNSETPNNSIVILNGSYVTEPVMIVSNCKVEPNEDMAQEEECSFKSLKDIDSMPIVSGGASMQDHINNHTDDSQSRNYFSFGSSNSNQNSITIIENVSFPFEKLDVSSDIVDGKTKTKTVNNEKSSEKFFIDFSSLPDTVAPLEKESKSMENQNNIFSMYIDLGNDNSVKKIPPRLSARKLSSSKSPKLTKASNDLSEPFFKFSVNENSKHVDHDLKKSPRQKSCSKSEDSDNIVNTNKKIIEANDNNEKFVRLSDLDGKNKISANINESLVLNLNKKESDSRMTRSIPESNWGDMYSSVISVSRELIHSENALSLNRLFPNLKNQLSKSMPGSITLFNRSSMKMSVNTNSELCNPSESLQCSSTNSSITRPLLDISTDESQLLTLNMIGNCQSKLGQDLLRMFLDEIVPDVVVEVAGRRIKAHKCILSSRCQYFAAILSGGWVESAGNVIVLPPFSYNVVHFALCHIYSGVPQIPDNVSIVELATFADMLCLEGLKEVIMKTLKTKYCHNFHKPCPVCIAGVLECFPLSFVYNLEDLCLKCLKWITRHFVKLWPTKAFATLPAELLDKCYHQHVVNMAAPNVIDTVCGCGIIKDSLPRSWWASTVKDMCRRLMNECANFISGRLEEVMVYLSAMNDDIPRSAAHALDLCVVAAIDGASCNDNYRVNAFLSKLVKDMEVRNISGQSYFASRAIEWKMRCETAFIRSGEKGFGVNISTLDKMKPKQGRGDQTRFPAKKPLSVKSKQTSAPTTNQFISNLKLSLVPFLDKPKVASKENINNSRVSVNSKNRVPAVRTTKAQEERAKFNMAAHKSTIQEKSVDRKKKPQSRFEKTKSRYLNTKTNVERKTYSNENINKRNNRYVQERCDSVMTMSQDSLATRSRTPEPSISHLQSPSVKYGTYTKPASGKQTRQACQAPARQVEPQDGTRKNFKSKIPIFINQYRKPDIGEKIIQNGTCKGETRYQEVPLLQRSGTFLKEGPTFTDVFN